MTQLIGKRVGKIAVAYQRISANERDQIWDFRDGYFLIEHLRTNSCGVEEKVSPCEWLTKEELKQRGIDYKEEECTAKA